MFNDQLDGGIIPPNNFVVLNDHDYNQHDSRQFGLIDKKDIIVIISLRYYPFSKWTIQFKSLKEVSKLKKEFLEWIISIAVAFVILFIVRLLNIEHNSIIIGLKTFLLISVIR